MEMTKELSCKDCGHLITEHLRDYTGMINCQICERNGHTCS